MPILKPIFCAVTLVRIHVIKPLQALLIDPDTNYSTLSVTFPKFYEELKTVNSEELCSTSHQVLQFVPIETFERCIPSQDVCKAIDETCQNNKCEIIHLLQLMISKIADKLQALGSLGFGLTRKMVRIKAAKFAAKQGIKGMGELAAGKTWYYGFIK